MNDDRDSYPLTSAAALEHLTGPRRGTVTWLSGSPLNIFLGANRILRLSEPRPDEPAEQRIAHLQMTDGHYKITANAGRSVWVNGLQVTEQTLENRDTIEFGDTGPLSRYHVYREDVPVRKMVTDLLSDGLIYLRVSRQPIPLRIVKAVYGLAVRLTRETTLLFRVSISLAIIALAMLTIQQYQMNVSLQQRIETGADRLDRFAGALAQAKGEALTPNDLKTLRQELGLKLSSNAGRLAALERRSKASARVIAQSKSLVVFLQGAYGFRDRSSRRLLRHVIDDEGRLLVSPIGQPLLSLDGDGPVADRQYIGTAFAVGNSGALVTNRHVALPWTNDASVDILAAKGLEPVMTKFIAYTPGKTMADDVELVRASDRSDLAVLRRVDIADPSPGLILAKHSPSPGDEVIVMGYPTGLRSMLAQAGEDFVDELMKSEDTGFWSVAARLAKKGQIAPLSSRGIVSQTSSATIVYDAETTLGGSGGPVLDINGAVVAVNAAILPEYGGSNLGVPVAELQKLLDQTGLQ